MIYKEDPISGKRIYEQTHQSGAKMLALKCETSLSAGAASLPFGGGCSEICAEGFRYFPTFPGSAHFAEHMMLTGGKLDRFCTFGADANAETSMSLTTYYITAGEKFLYSLGDFASMMVRPSFAKNEIEKEREIIFREKKEDDDVFTRGRNAVTDMIFSSGSIRREIIGDRKSIKKVNEKLLRAIYSCGYKPSVISFAAVSSEEPQKIFEMLAAALLGQKPTQPPVFKTVKSQRREDGEDYKEIKSGTEESLLFIGISPDISCLNGDYAKGRVYSSMLEAMLFDRTEYMSSCLLGDDGIYGSFRSDCEIFSGELLINATLSCKNPKETAEKIKEAFSLLKEKGAGKLFPNIEAKRRSLVADYLATFDSPQDLALTLAEYSALGASFTDVGEALLAFDEKDFLAFANKSLENATLKFAGAK